MRRLVATQSDLGHQKATFHQMKTKAWILHVLLNYTWFLDITLCRSNEKRNEKQYRRKDKVYTSAFMI
jgi:hypothetical protein